MMTQLKIVHTSFHLFTISQLPQVCLHLHSLIHSWFYFVSCLTSRPLRCVSVSGLTQRLQSVSAHSVSQVRCGGLGQVCRPTGIRLKQLTEECRARPGPVPRASGRQMLSYHRSAPLPPPTLSKTA